MNFLRHWLRWLTRHREWCPRVDFLALLVVIAGGTFYTSLVPLMPNDFWWHLKIGEVIYTTHTIPRTAMFSWSLPADRPFFYGAWLAEYLFYIVYRWGGVALLTCLRNVLFALSFYWIGREAHRRSKSWYLAALVVAIGCMMTGNNVLVRPQMWSWGLFVGILVLLSRYVDGQLNRWVLLLCPLMVALWANLHGAFVLGIVLVGAFVVGEAIRCWLKMPGARSWSEVRWLGGIAALVGLAPSLNPRGLSIYYYVWNLMTDQPSQTLITEWQSPIPQGVANITFFVSILLLLLVLWYSTQRPNPTDVLLVLGFLWLAWGGVRYVVWYALAVLPIFAAAIATVFPSVPRWGGAIRNFLNVLVILGLLIPVILVQPWVFEAMPLPFPQVYWDLVWRDVSEGTFLSIETPLSVTEYLKQHPGGRIFNEMGYGSYFIWAIPEQKVFIDPRVELYPYDQWRDYVNMVHGNRSEVLFDQYQVDRVVLDRSTQEDLVTVLQESDSWHLLYEDDQSQVWGHCPGVFCE